MKGSPGLSSSAFWIELSRLGQAQLALGERIAEGVVGMVMVRLELDHPAQQPLHLLHVVELLDDHRLLVEQIGVVRERLVRRHQDLVGLGPLLGLAQQLGLGDVLGAGIGGGLLGHAADELPRLGHPALLGEERRPARLHLEGPLRVVDLGQPALGRGEVALLLGRLRQQQPGLRQRRACRGRHIVVAVVVAGCRRGTRADGGAASTSRT